MSDRPKPLLGSVFQNALATTPTHAAADAGAGMHNTLACARCGAPREKRAPGEDESLVCRYCGHALAPARGAR